MLPALIGFVALGGSNCLTDSFQVTLCRVDQTFPSLIESAPSHLRDNLYCGPDSLALAAGILGVETTIEAIVARIEMTERGTSMAALARAAEGLGLAPQAYELRSIETLRRLSKDTPAIILLRGNHFALAWGGEGGGIWLAEYPHPLRRVEVEELAREADRRILLLRRPETPDPLARVGWWKWPVAGALFLAAIAVALLPRIKRRAAQSAMAS
jgi:ABC-type bacteriocin/lantibiotic exporter with double-glycine peptidase domain